MKKHSRLVNKWVLLGAALIAVVVLFYAFILFSGTNYSENSHVTPIAQITVLAAGSIPTTDIQLLELTATPTQSSTESYNGISIGDYVIIQGTEGSGLRIRMNPGLSSDTEFVANESDVYIVIEGPSELDGLIWWKLATPYDENRQGWAAADYLSAVTQQ
jgi:hypothetical protein